MKMITRKIPVKIAKKKSDLEEGVMYKMHEGKPMIYEGIIEGQYSFMHKFVENLKRTPILSWRNEGVMRFTKEGIVLGNFSNFELYEGGIEIYDKKEKIIEGAQR